MTDAHRRPVPLRLPVGSGSLFAERVLGVREFQDIDTAIPLSFIRTQPGRSEASIGVQGEG